MKLSLLFVALVSAKKCKNAECVLKKMDKYMGDVWNNFYQPDPQCAKRSAKSHGQTRVQRGQRIVLAMRKRFTNDGCTGARRRRETQEIDQEYDYDYEEFVFDPAQPRVSKTNRLRAIKQLRNMGNRFHKKQLQGCDNQSKVDTINTRFNTWCNKLQDAKCL